MTATQISKSRLTQVPNHHGTPLEIRTRHAFASPNRNIVRKNGIALHRRGITDDLGNEQHSFYTDQVGVGPKNPLALAKPSYGGSAFSVSTSVPLFNNYNVAYGNGVYVCTSSYGGLLISEDLVNWETVYYPGVMESYTELIAQWGGGWSAPAYVCFDDAAGLFYAVTGGAGQYTSPNGRDWYRMEDSEMSWTANAWGGIAAKNDILVAARYSGSSSTIVVGGSLNRFSTLGKTCAIPRMTALDAKFVYINKNNTIITGNGPLIAKTDDLTTYTIVRDFADTSFSGTRFFKCPSGKLYVLSTCNAGLDIAYSNDDGVSWSFQTAALPTNPGYSYNSYSAVVLNDVIFFSYKNKLFKTVDLGQTWIEVTTRNKIGAVENVFFEDLAYTSLTINGLYVINNKLIMQPTNTTSHNGLVSNNGEDWAGIIPNLVQPSTLVIDRTIKTGTSMASSGYTIQLNGKTLFSTSSTSLNFLAVSDSALKTTGRVSSVVGVDGAVASTGRFLYKFSETSAVYITSSKTYVTKDGGVTWDGLTNPVANASVGANGLVDGKLVAVMTIAKPAQTFSYIVKIDDPTNYTNPTDCIAFVSTPVLPTSINVKKQDGTVVTSQSLISNNFYANSIGKINGAYTMTAAVLVNNSTTFYGYVMVVLTSTDLTTWTQSGTANANVCSVNNAFLQTKGYIYNNKALVPQSDGLYTSTDMVNFTKIDKIGDIIINSPPTLLACNSNYGAIFLIATNMPVAYTLDMGSTWTMINYGTEYDYLLNSSTSTLSVHLHSDGMYRFGAFEDIAVDTTTGKGYITNPRAAYPRLISNSYPTVNPRNKVTAFNNIATRYSLVSFDKNNGKFNCEGKFNLGGNYYVDGDIEYMVSSTAIYARKYPEVNFKLVTYTTNVNFPEQNAYLTQVSLYTNKFYCADGKFVFLMYVGNGSMAKYYMCYGSYGSTTVNSVDVTSNLTFLNSTLQMLKVNGKYLFIPIQNTSAEGKYIYVTTDFTSYTQVDFSLTEPTKTYQYPGFLGGAVINGKLFIYQNGMVPFFAPITSDLTQSSSYSVDGSLKTSTIPVIQMMGDVGYAWGPTSNSGDDYSKVYVWAAQVAQTSPLMPMRSYTIDGDTFAFINNGVVARTRDGIKWMVAGVLPYASGIGNAYNTATFDKQGDLIMISPSSLPGAYTVGYQKLIRPVIAGAYFVENERVTPDQPYLKYVTIEGDH